MSRLTSLSILLPSLLVTACAADDIDPDTAEVSGEMRYRDATTAHDGSAAEPATPDGDRATITLEVRGTGTIDGVDPSCALDAASGAFQATFDADVALGPDGGYVAALAAGDGRLETLGGCEIPNLTVAVVTDVVVRAELAATTERCSTYCAASARADAEAECGADAEAAACRAEAEASAEAACTTTCTTEATSIVAEASLAASLLGDLDADSLRAAAFGDLAVDLTFDHLE